MRWSGSKSILSGRHGLRLCPLLWLAFFLTNSVPGLAQELVYTYEFESGLPFNPPKPDYKPQQSLRFQEMGSSGTRPPKPEIKPARSLSLAGIRLPIVLSSQDRMTYTAAFRAVSQAKWSQVDNLLTQVSDEILKGNVLAAKYLAQSYRPQAGELIQWLERYGDHPDANSLAELARAEIAGNRVNYSLPSFRGTTSPLPIPSLEQVSRHRWHKASRYESQRKEILKRIRRALYKDRYGDAEMILAYEAPDFFDHIEIQNQYARLAGEIYYDGTIDEAYQRSLSVINAVQQEAPYAYWIAGLCAWRQKDYRAAQRFFKSYATSPATDRWEKAAGYFWAARSLKQQGQNKEKKDDLEAAARYHETFYGLLARRLLGWVTKSGVKPYSPTETDIKRVLARKPGKRAFALYQVGQYRRAEQEMAQIARIKQRDLRRSLLRVAESVNMPELSIRLAHYKSVNDKTYDYRGLFPIPVYQPEGGFSIDRALLYGIMKRESMFNPRLESRANARGLLQVYPPSATWMVKTGRIKPYKLSDLFIPGKNLAIGQHYLKYLLTEHKSVKGDLVRFLVGYNAGPNRIKNWEARARHGNDPLLFMESIPARETRDYVERTLTYIWRYRDRMGQNLDEIDQLANREWPLYRPMDSN